MRHFSLRDFYFVRREVGMQHLGKACHALLQGHWKIPQNPPFQPFELYHLNDNPQEQNDLAKAKPDVFTHLAKALSRHIQRGGATPWHVPGK